MPRYHSTAKLRPRARSFSSSATSTPPSLASSNSAVHLHHQDDDKKNSHAATMFRIHSAPQPYHKRTARHHPCVPPTPTLPFCLPTHRSRNASRRNLSQHHIHMSPSLKGDDSPSDICPYSALCSEISNNNCAGGGGGGGGGGPRRRMLRRQRRLESSNDLTPALFVQDTARETHASRRRPLALFDHTTGPDAFCYPQTVSACGVSGGAAGAGGGGGDQNPFAFYTNAVRAELGDLDLVRAISWPPKSRRCISPFFTWWSTFNHFVNRIHDIIERNLIPLARRQLERCASIVPQATRNAFELHFLPGFLSEIETSKDLLANVENKLLLVSKLIGIKDNQLVLDSAVAALKSAIKEAIPHLRCLMNVIDVQLYPVCALSRLSPAGLKTLHADCAATILSGNSPSAKSDDGLVSVAILMRGLTTKSAIDDYIHTALCGVRRARVYRVMQWVHTHHFGLAETAKHLLR